MYVFSFGIRQNELIRALVFNWHIRLSYNKCSITYIWIYFYELLKIHGHLWPTSRELICTRFFILIDDFFFILFYGSQGPTNPFTVFNFDFMHLMLIFAQFSCRFLINKSYFQKVIFLTLPLNAPIDNIANNFTFIKYLLTPGLNFKAAITYHNQIWFQFK